jgi:hypothetical protein
MTRRLTLPRRLLLKAGFGLALVVTMVFAFKLGETAFHWDQSRNRQGLEPWMTPRYVAHSRRVPTAVVGAVLGFDPAAPPRRQTLREIAAQRGVPVEDLLAELDAAIAAHREAQR